MWLVSELASHCRENAAMCWCGCSRVGGMMQFASAALAAVAFLLAFLLADINTHVTKALNMFQSCTCFVCTVL
jgi:hypothetical protein